METLVLLKIRTQFKHLQNQAAVLLLVDKMRFQVMKVQNNRFHTSFISEQKLNLKFWDLDVWSHRLEKKST